MTTRLWDNQQEIQERVILVGICTGDERETRESLDELQQLADTAGAVTVGRLIQNLSQPAQATYLGSGKLWELADLIDETDATGIICDDELSPAQIRGLEKELSCKIMDRTLLILDIFASRAVTGEGKMQVELAQLQYRLSRLAGLGTSLSRLGGGIGTRGPGEKKLEIDRRLIRKRISRLKSELKETAAHRNLLRENRQKKGRPVLAIAGYTNAGKSTLLNTLTRAGVLQEDKLFATLDPATRVLSLPDGQEVLLTDTVGFIRKLPHHLIDAFRSTLEETVYADLILHVVDSASPQMEKQMHVVYETLRGLGVQDKPIVTLYNKCDLTGHEACPRDLQADRTFAISALTGQGIEAVLLYLQQALTKDQIRIERRYPYDQAGKLQLIRQYGRLLSVEYQDDGIYVHAYVPPGIYGNL